MNRYPVTDDIRYYPTPDEQMPLYLESGADTLRRRADQMFRLSPALTEATHEVDSPTLAYDVVVEAELTLQQLVGV